MAHNSSITRIDMAYNGIQSRDSVTAIQTACSVRCGFPQRHSAHFSRAQIASYHVYIFFQLNKLHAYAADLASRTTRLTAIQLPSSFLKMWDLTSLIAALDRNTTVTSVDLRFNLIDNDGANLLASSLMRSNHTITELRLDGNPMDKVAAESLSEIKAVCEVRFCHFS